MTNDGRAPRFSPDGSLVAAAGGSKEDAVVHLYRCDVCGSLDNMIEQATRRLTP